MVENVRVVWTSACASCAHAVHPARRATVVCIDSGQRIRQPVYSHSQLPTQCTLELEPSHSQLPTQCTLELERSHSQLPTQCSLELERLRDKHVDTFCHLRGGTHIGVERKSKLGFGEVAASHDGIGACGARRCGCELPRQWLLRGSQLVEDRWRDRHFQRGLGIGWVGARGQRACREAQAEKRSMEQGRGVRIAVFPLRSTPASATISSVACSAILSAGVERDGRQDAGMQMVFSCPNFL